MCGPHAPIAQLAEAADLKSAKCGFESHWGHYCAAGRTGCPTMAWPYCRHKPLPGAVVSGPSCPAGPRSEPMTPPGVSGSSDPRCGITTTSAACSIGSDRDQRSRHGRSVRPHRAGESRCTSASNSDASWSVCSRATVRRVPVKSVAGLVVWVMTACPVTGFRERGRPYRGRRFSEPAGPAGVRTRRGRIRPVRCPTCAYRFGWVAELMRGTFPL